MKIASLTVADVEPDGVVDLIRYIAERDVDIICLQDIQRTIFGTLVRRFKEAGYNHQINSRIDTDIFIKIDTKTYSMNKIAFQHSVENRDLLVVDLELLNGERAVIATGTLDSAPTIKRKQLLAITDIAKDTKAFIFLGDTQITSYELTKTPFEDAWFDVGDSTNKFTRDCNTNSLVDDRICDRNERCFGKGIEFQTFELLTKSFNPPISENYGLLVSLSVIE